MGDDVATLVAVADGTCVADGDDDNVAAAVTQVPDGVAVAVDGDDGHGVATPELDAEDVIVIVIVIVNDGVPAVVEVDVTLNPADVASGVRLADELPVEETEGVPLGVGHDVGAGLQRPVVESQYA